MARLVVVEGPDKGKILEFSEEKTLGSCSHQADFSLEEEEMGKEHFRIFREEEGRWAITCKNRDRGVEVNSRRCLHSHLEHSDIIQVGSTVLMFLDDDHTGQVEAPTRPSTIQARQKTYEDAQTVIETLSKTERPEKRLSTLYKISNVLGQVDELEELCKQILSILFEEFPADRGAILFRQNSNDSLEEVASHTKEGSSSEELRISQTILQEVMGSEEALLTKDAISDDRFQAGQSIVELNIHSAISVPLKPGPEVIGILYIDTVKESDAFSTDDLKLLTAIGMQVGNVMEKIRLQQVKREKEKLELEKREAERVQQFLIPRKILRPVGLGIATKYVLSQGLGGDYYDILPLDNDRTAIVIADVSGHSISSALVMCMCRSVLRQFCKESNSPGEILRRTNQVLVQDIISGMFITLFLAIFDPMEFGISYASAGHPYPFHLTSEGIVSELKVGGVPLGIMPEATYREDYLSLSQGDSLFLYTDGLVEMKNPQGQIFGRDQVRKILCEKHELSPQSLIEYTFQAASRFKHTARLADDVSLVALRVPNHLTRHQFEIPSLVDEVEPLTTQVMDILKQRGFGGEREKHLNLVLREAVMNAITHGNQSDPTKKVTLVLHIEDERAYVQVRDQGEGFDTSKIIDDFRWIPGENSHGRGILLIRQYVDRMRYNQKGNQIYLEFSKSTF